MNVLPDNLYSVDSVIQLEQVAIKQFDIPAYELMTRAGAAVFNVIKARYANCKKILVLCGAGNNAGDGYVVARLAKLDGFDIHVVSLIDPSKLSGAALTAYSEWCEIGEVNLANSQQETVSDDSPAVSSIIEQSDLIIDALLGTGLTRRVSDEWCRWIEIVNRLPQPVISVDIPSGLFADTGTIAGEAICADVTVSFIGLKQGMFTSQAKDFTGEVLYSDLDLPEEIFTKVKPDARLIKQLDYSLLKKRKASSHKGSFGHVLITGGNAGMPGAVILAARAALRTGAGRVTIVTVEQNLAAISSAVPEAMIKICADTPGSDDTKGVSSIENLFAQSFIDDISHIAVGMGLGQDRWSLAVLEHCLRLKKPVLVDADGLNLLAKNRYLYSDISPDRLILTPHPGEAARLLSSSTDLSASDIQRDRFTTIRNIHKMFQNNTECAVILKGSGTLLFDGELIRICQLGNAAMAAPGMGDVLSGIIIALLAQSITINEAVELGVCVHAFAAQRFTGDKTRGLMASDIIEELPAVLQ